MTMWPTLLCVASGGALGAVSRYLLSVGAVRLWGEHFPFGTLLVNVLGCFCLGLLAESVGDWHPAAKPGIGVGFLGALTTFSTFGVETLKHLEKGEFGVALLNVSANLLVGLLAVWLGVTLGRSFAGGAN